MQPSIGRQRLHAVAVKAVHSQGRTRKRRLMYFRRCNICSWSCISNYKSTSSILYRITLDTFVSTHNKLKQNFNTVSDIKLSYEKHWQLHAVQQKHWSHVNYAHITVTCDILNFLAVTNSATDWLVRLVSESITTSTLTFSSGETSVSSGLLNLAQYIYYQNYWTGH